MSAKEKKNKQTEEEEEIEEEVEEEIEKKPKETKNTIQKNKKEEKKDNQEEEEEEEIEEEVEEKDDDEEEEEVEEEKNKTDEQKISLQKPKDGFEISMELIIKFKEISPEEPEEAISDFIKEKGLPMSVKDEETLVLLLYFHKLCVPFYKILNSLNKKDILKVFLSSLKDSYYLFADTQSKHFNYKSIAKKVFLI